MAEITLITPPGTKLIDLAMPFGVNNVGPDRRYNTLAWPGTVGAWIKKYFPHKEVAYIDMQKGAEERQYKDLDYEARKLRAFHTGKPLAALEKVAQEGRSFLLHSNTTYESSGLVEAAQTIRKINPKAVILAGGMDVSARPEFYLSYVDTVVVGEIEALGKEQLERIIEGNDRGIIKGTNKIDMNNIPLPALDLINLDEFQEHSAGNVRDASTVYSIETSRGCPRQCLFCTTSKLKGSRIRELSLTKLEEQLLHLKKAGVSHVEIYDDAFLLGRSEEEIREKMQVFRKVGIPFSWPNGSIEMGLLYDNKKREVKEDIIKSLYSSPFSMAYLPIDKVTASQMGQYNKFNRFDFDKELDVLKAIASMGVPALHFGIIIGTADETREDRTLTRERALQIYEKLKRSNKNRLVYGHIFISLPAPGSKHYETYRKEATPYPPEQNSPLWNFYVAQWVTKDAAPGEITRERDEIFRAVNGQKALDSWRRTGRFICD